MSASIARGDQGRTVGPLRPSGQIRVHGQIINARSDGSWIDTEVDVVVLDYRSSGALVCAATEIDPTSLVIGSSEPSEPQEDPPLSAPPAAVEQVNGILWGTIVGCLAVPVIYLAGTPLSGSALFVPIAGALAGLAFQLFVRPGAEWATPYADHRPIVNAVAGSVVAGSLVGGALGVLGGFGFVGLSLGLVTGAAMSGCLVMFLVPMICGLFGL